MTMLRPSISRRTAVLLSSACLLTLALGCGSSRPTPETEDTVMNRDLENFGEMYRMVSLATGKPPRNLNDVKQAEAGLTGGLTQLTEGNFVVFWGTPLTDLGEEAGRVPSDKVLAYEKQVPEQGGHVLLLDRTIKKVTADEFKSMPKAGAEPPAEATKKG